MIEFTTQVVTPGATIHSDGALVFNRLTALGYSHLANPSSKGGYQSREPDAVMPGPHMVSSLLKRWAAGTLNYRLIYQHMPYDLDEWSSPHSGSTAVTHTSTHTSLETVLNKW